MTRPYQHRLELELKLESRVQTYLHRCSRFISALFGPPSVCRPKREVPYKIKSRLSRRLACVFFPLFFILTLPWGEGNWGGGGQKGNWECRQRAGVSDSSHAQTRLSTLRLWQHSTLVVVSRCSRSCCSLCICVRNLCQKNFFVVCLFVCILKSSWAILILFLGKYFRRALIALAKCLLDFGLTLAIALQMQLKSKIVSNLQARHNNNKKKQDQTGCSHFVERRNLFDLVFMAKSPHIAVLGKPWNCRWQWQDRRPSRNRNRSQQFNIKFKLFIVVAIVGWVLVCTWTYFIFLYFYIIVLLRVGRLAANYLPLFYDECYGSLCSTIIII